MTLVDIVTGEIVTTEMTTDEARALTDEIKSDIGGVWNKLLYAHEHCAWAALGYSTCSHVFRLR